MCGGGGLKKRKRCKKGESRERDQRGTKKIKGERLRRKRQVTTGRDFGPKESREGEEEERTDSET